jgi:hypothetical protein
MDTLKEVGRQAAERAWRDCNGVAPNSGDIIHVMADAVTLAVVEYFFKADTSRRLAGWSPSTRYDFLEASLSEASRELALSPPSAECPLCHELVAEVVTCAESSRGRCPMKTPSQSSVEVSPAVSGKPEPGELHHNHAPVPFSSLCVHGYASCISCDHPALPLAPTPPDEGHREVTPEEHAPWDGRNHGDCIICRVPFPCESAGDDRQRMLWAENLIRQLPPDHEGRNSWLMNYGTAQAHERNLPTHFVADKPIASITIVAPTPPETVEQALDALVEAVHAYGDAREGQRFVTDPLKDVNDSVNALIAAVRAESSPSPGAVETPPYPERGCFLDAYGKVAHRLSDSPDGLCDCTALRLRSGGSR